MPPLDLDLIDKLDELIAEVELHLTRTAKVDDMQTYHRLRTIPGVGPILALVLLYEIHEVSRFEHGRPVPVVRAAGALRPRVGRQEAGLWRQEDRQRPPALGLRRGRLPVPAWQRAGPALEAEAGEETRLGQGPGHPGRTPGRVPSTTCCASRKRSTRTASGTARPQQRPAADEPEHSRPLPASTPESARAAR